eukprot:SM000169S02706  [mRNA]  locus=s169:54909:56102:- [translate_table: standard]
MQFARRLALDQVVKALDDAVFEDVEVRPAPQLEKRRPCSTIYMFLYGSEVKEVIADFEGLSVEEVEKRLTKLQEEEEERRSSSTKM